MENNQMDYKPIKKKLPQKMRFPFYTTKLSFNEWLL